MSGESPTRPGIKTPSVVAKYVLQYTDHIMLVGEGAKKFALSYGFKEENLLTDSSRERWLKWRANRGPDDDWINVTDTDEMAIRPTGTINMNTVNTDGDISSVTTTSGLSWKIPGRVGDSPLGVLIPSSAPTAPARRVGPCIHDASN